MVRFGKKLFSLIFIMAPAFAGVSQDFTIQSTDQSMQVYQQLTYQVDSTGSSINNILSQEFSKQIPSAYYFNDKVVFWIKLTVTNKTRADQFVITIDQWNEASLFLQNDSAWAEVVSGTNLPVAKRPLSLHRLLSFPVVIQPGQTRTFIFKTRITKPIMRYYANLFSFLSKMEIDESSHAYKKYIGNQLFVMLILGVTSILFFYNLMLFFFDRQKTSFILSLYFIDVSLLVANIHGITTNYLFVPWQAFELTLALHLAHLTPIVVAAFLMAFFKLNKRHWEFYVLALFISFISFSWIFSIASDQSMFFFARRYVEYGTFIVVMGSFVWKRKAGALIIMTALLVAIITSYYAELRAVFFANITFLGPDTPYLIGIFTQVIIFSVAATYRVRSLQRGVDEMKEEQRRLIEKQNEYLKTQVDEKTEQLQTALKTLQQKKSELEEVNHELAQQSASVHHLNQRLEKLVANRTDALNATMRDLDTFLYRTSHDLRRPLMTILGISNLVAKEKDVETIHSMMAHINKTVSDLDRMLKKLIAISFCYSERVDKEPIDLRLLVNEVVLSVTKENSLEKEAIQVVFKQPLSALVSNAYLLKMMLGCVLENSAQYRSSTLQISLVVESDQGMLQLSVQDNGPGIDMAYQKPVFDMFFRAHEKSTGNGLGLYLVKIGVEKLGGTVKLFSEVDKGTTISIIFPLSTEN